MKILGLLLFLLSTQISFGQYQLNGNATKDTCNCYTLTQAANTQRGSVWNVNKINLYDSFNFRFEVFLGCSNGGADGICFGLQPNGTSVGTNGGGMGMAGVTPSIGVFIDTYQNGNHFDPFDDHVSLNANGDIYHDGGKDDLAGPISILNIEDCLWHTLEVEWNPTTTTMIVTLDNNLMFNYVGNLVDSIFSGDSMVYWGFTGATGGLNNLQRICTTLEPDIYLDDDTLCQGESIFYQDSSITFGGVDSWHWDFGTGDTDTVANPVYIYNVPGSYQTILTITDQSGCSAKDTMNVLVNATADAGRDSSISICNSGVVFRLNLLKDTSSGNFAWRETSANLSGQFDTLTSIFNANGLAVGFYTFEFIQKALFPCVNDTSLVTINITPSALNAGADGSLELCQNDNSTDLFLSLSSSPDLGGDWFDSTLNLIDQFFDPQTDSSGIYSYVVSDAECADTAFVTVTVLDTPSIEIISPDEVCVLDEFELHASGSGITSWIWDNGSSSEDRPAVINRPITARYTLTATHSNGCTSKIWKTVQAKDYPYVEANPDTSVEAGDNVMLSATANGYTTSAWSPGEDLSDSTSLDTEWEADVSTQFFIRVWNDIGCMSEDSMIVEVDSTITCVIKNLYIPNSFTPNGDGNNDKHLVFGYLGDQFHMRIYDRFGTLVFETKDALEGWDGFINGKAANPGVYVYSLFVSCTDGSGSYDYKGNITLLR